MWRQFGAFVDLGVHQDGLVHVSQLSTSSSRTHATIAKIGAIVTVRVVELDLARKRIGIEHEAGRGAPASGRPAGQPV
jgi:uncharacterized protein